MTTLHVERDALDEVVGRLSRWCARSRSSTDFPHGMRIRVIEHRPAAIADRRRRDRRWRPTARCSRACRCTGRCRRRADRAASTARGWPRGAALGAARVAGAAPAALRRGCARSSATASAATWSQLRDGPGARLRQRHAAARQVGRRRARAGRPRRRGRRATWTCACPARPAVGGLPVPGPLGAAMRAAGAAAQDAAACAPRTAERQPGGARTPQQPSPPQAPARRPAPPDALRHARSGRRALRARSQTLDPGSRVTWQPSTQGRGSDAARSVAGSVDIAPKPTYSPDFPAICESANPRRSLDARTNARRTETRT